MRRRTLLVALGGSVFSALATRAKAQAVPVVGFLNSASAATYSFNAAAFVDGLREAGYVEGRNVAIEYRWANNDYTRLSALATELAKRGVAVIAATGGILLSYGTSIQWMYREAGNYVGRILKGARPSDLPIIQPTKFDLVINLKSARALGLTIPQSLLLRADEVIR